MERREEGRKKNVTATKGGRERGKRKSRGGDTRVSKDVMRERNGENEMRNVRERASERARTDACKERKE